MKVQQTHKTNISQSMLCIVVVTLLWVAGCATSTPNPLAGWKHYFNAHFDKALTDDYRDYIQKLPPKEKQLIDDYSIEPLENDAGGHAVKIEIPRNGTFREHLLIYDKNNTRIKTFIYSGGHYRS